MESTRKRGVAAWTIGLAIAASPLSSALALTITDPAGVLMIDGIDGNVTVNVTAADGTLPLGTYDFGFLAGGSYTQITSTIGSHTFNGGDLVNFALRNRGADNIFGTGDDLIYGIADPNDYADQIYTIEIDPANSQNPVVTSPYYRSLLLTWDLDQNGVMDTGFTLGVTTPLLSYDGMAPVVIPVPAAVWLLGSGLLGLGATARRRRR